MNDDLSAQKARTGAQPDSGQAYQTTRPGAVLEGRAVINPTAPVSPDDSGDDESQYYATPLDPLEPKGLNPVGSSAFLGLALAGAAAWLLFGRKKKQGPRRR